MYRISCPQCGKTLKFKDATRIGRKAKCPGCEHRFVLTLPEQPDEVELQLAEPRAPAPQAAQQPNQPLTGTSARWVPDGEPSQPVAPAPAALQQQPIGLQQPAPPPTQAPPPPGPQQPAIQQPHQLVPPGVQQPVAPPPAAGQFPDFAIETPLVFPTGDDVTSPVSEIRKRNRKRGKTGMVVGVIGLLLAGGVGIAAFFSQPEQPGKINQQPAKVVANEAWDQEKAALEQSSDELAKVSPTNGAPISFQYLPPGAAILLNTHPSRLWSDDDARKEFRFALGTQFGDWLSGYIENLTGFKPAEIEQLTLGIALGPRESEPEVSAVVRLRKPMKAYDMAKSHFNASLDPTEEAAKLYTNEDHAFVVIDEKTFSVGPQFLQQDLVTSTRFAADPTNDLQALLQETDTDRDITLLVDRSALEIHTPTLLPEPVRPAIVQFTDWLGKDVDSAIFSLHLGERMYLETVLRNGTGTTPAKLNRHVRSKLRELPTDVLEMVRFMRPGRSGPRKVIARFPAMTQALAAATDSGIGARSVQLTTILPERALPNLAVGTMLTWDESTRTDFNRERVEVTQKPKPELPSTLAGRLQMKVEVDFNRTPLQEAFALLGEDIGVKFQLDGDGLKLAGYTQNMAQSFNLGTVSAIDGLKKILSQYDKMVLVADEATMGMKVTTKDGIAASGEKAYDLK